jgi:phosphatidylglycerophosphate synthase
VRTVHAGPVTGLIAQLLLLAGLAATVGLSGTGWAVGIAAALITDTALARGLLSHGRQRLGPADWVTLTRATLSIGVAALVAYSFDHSIPTALLVGLTAAALVLDAVDGWVVRRTNTGSALGARFDGEVDAFLILVLSVYVADLAGWWVLAIGLARYVFLAAGWFLPWLRGELLPPRGWRKVVAAWQGITLMIAAADILPLPMARIGLAISLALLAESFGRDTWWLFVRRGQVAVTARGRVRTGVATVVTVLAFLLVWAALVAPDQENRLTVGAFVRLPLEGVAVVALALILPGGVRRALAWLVGPLLGLLVIVKALDMGFFATFDRPFDPVGDLRYTGIGIETLRDSIGRTTANLLVVGGALLGIGLLTLMTVAVLRLTGVAASNRRFSLPAVGALAAVWTVCWVFGTPLASTSAAGLVVDEVRAVQAGLDDHAVFADQIRHDRYRSTPGNQLLTKLKGKDVLLVFVESYGQVAVQGSSFSAKVDATLRQGTRDLRSAGFEARSGWLTSSTFGGLSWLAHSTMQAGVWVNSQRRYDQLTGTRRLTLTEAFGRAGWRTVGDVPSNNRTWPEGTTFYHYDKLYDRRDVGYHGPTYAYASMPDQYVWAAFQRLELGKRHRKPLFAEIDLVSSHAPWTRIPHLIPWNEVGDGSIFRTQPVESVSRSALYGDHAKVRAAYGRSVQYTMSALVSFVQHYGRKNLVLIVLGDHQPAKVVTGENPTHNVPVSIIARDPEVLQQISSWSWEDGLLPSSKAPLWRMSSFRDRFLGAFGSSG